MQTKEPKGLLSLVDGKITPAQVIEPKKGGIDLNPTIMNLRSKGKSAPLHFPRLNTEQLNELNINGLYPIIINISPILNVPQLLGIKEEDEENNLKSEKLAQKSS